MPSFLRYSLGLVLSGFVISSCAIKDLRDDLDAAKQEYGYFKGQANSADDGSNLLIGLFERDADSISIANIRTVNSGEPFYMLVPKADYMVLAFSDSNGDFVYQRGEPAARVDNPTINWFSDMKLRGRIDYEALQTEQIELTSTAVLEQKIDMSLTALRQGTRASENLLRVVSWDDEIFSTENANRGLWEPSWFQKEVGFGLYVLKEFDPAKNSILLVHGIDDTPRVFETLANAIPADYQLLLFHYPSGFPLEYTSYILNELLDELIRRNQIPQLDIIAHSMGGLVGKGVLHQADEALRQRLRLFISIASPFGGHAAAEIGTKWSPVVAPVWWAMTPGSQYLQKISGLDLSQGPSHHLIFTFSHETDGKSEGDDGVVTVKSQLTQSAQRNATAIYGIADSHTGVVNNPCTSALLTAILRDGTTRVTIPDC
jgi:pimeloyl-ACP methyl ester carboxylesterase